MSATVDKQKNHALAACRSIEFAFENAKRHGGEWSLPDLTAAVHLAKEALGYAERNSRPDHEIKEGKTVSGGRGKIPSTPKPKINLIAQKP